MKKMIVGRISELILAIICLMLTFSLVIISFLVKIDIVSKIALIVFASIPVIVLIVQLQKNRELGTYVQISPKGIQLKRFGKVMQEYAIEEVKCGYSVWFYAQSALYPCLMITSKEIQARVEIMGYMKNYDYFIIVLTKKRLAYLSKWYNQKIVLLDDSLMELNYDGKERVENFYQLIYLYNKSQKDNK